MRFSRLLLTVSSGAAAAIALLVLAWAGSTHGSPPGETVTVAADQPIPNLPGKRLVSHIVDYPPADARPRTVTPARLSSTPTSSRARSGARSTASPPASTGPARRGLSAPAPITG